jgi:hypothetical protein
MQAQAYEGYFNNGQFYVLGREVRIPERKRVVITVLPDTETVLFVDEQEENELHELFRSGDTVAASDVLTKIEALPND